MSDAPRENPAEDFVEYVSVTIGRQLFGIPVARVRDVFVPGKMTRVPLAGPEIAGILNLRGRIVTAIEMRQRLGLPPREGGSQPMAVGIEAGGESYGLIIDAVGEILKLGPDTHEPVPANLEPRLARLARSIHRLEGQLLVVLDVDRVLDVENRSIAA
jgi:purine-binding chemotaxis protein CheW